MKRFFLKCKRLSYSASELEKSSISNLLKLMENSLLTVFLNVQLIVLQNNIPFDQTKKEFYLLLIFKKELLNFVLYFIKDLFMF